jgi:serine phosphatase RsbU (regulator of sigma subunit)/anti-sigma regulatory factor (Ser/Thr protein kinase)
MSRAPRISMRMVVISVTVAIVAAAVLAVGTVAERNTRQALTREAEARLLLEARNLALTAAGALLTDLPELTLHPVVRELAESRPELSFVVITDHKGRIQGHREARALGTKWKLPDGLAPAATEARLRDGEELLANRALLVVTVPVVSARGQRLGSAQVGLRRAALEQAVAAARRQQILWVTIVLAAGIGIAFIVLTLLLRPIGALRAGLERIGRGDLDTPIRITDRTELGLLADTVNDMARELKNAQRSAAERERLAHEVELARDLQHRLLPTGIQSVGDLTLCGDHRAAAEVGGDYVDLLPLADGRVAVAIADVSGKGLGGCLVMTMLAASLRALRNEHRSPRALLVALEEQLAPTLRPGEFVTMFYGVLDARTRTLVYASAGHTPLLVWRAARGEPDWQATRGIPLGLMRDGRLAGTLDDREVKLEPGDVLFQFTDGYNEAFSPRGEAFGFGRIADLVGGHAAQGPEAVIAALRESLAAWSDGHAPDDDQTVLMIARAAAHGTAAPATSGRLATADPVALHRRAAASGYVLTLAPTMEALEGLGPWLAALPGFDALPSEPRTRIETVLYELAANVVEHGGAHDQGLELAWLAGPDDPAADPVARVREGCFVLRDRGYPFRPGRRRAFDPAAHPAWMGGRGLGLEIVHRVVSEVVFRPGTTAGNLTLLSFDPARAQDDKEEQHG